MSGIFIGNKLVLRNIYINAFCIVYFIGSILILVLVAVVTKYMLIYYQKNNIITILPSIDFLRLDLFYE